MPDISELNLPDEAIPDIDYNAPEPGSFPPQIAPGVYEFMFHLPEKGSDCFDKQTVEGKDHAVFVHEAEALRNSKGEAVTANADGKQPLLRFQRASTYTHVKMPNSMLGDLLRSLNVHIDGPLTLHAVADALAAIDGRATYKGEVGWRSYCKSCDQTVSTHPRKKKGDAAWPRTAEGQYELTATCPKCGNKSYGNAEIVRYRLPERERS